MDSIWNFRADFHSRRLKKRGRTTKHLKKKTDHKITKIPLVFLLFVKEILNLIIHPTHLQAQLGYKIGDQGLKLRIAFTHRPGVDLMALIDFLMARLVIPYGWITYVIYLKNNTFLVMMCEKGSDNIAVAFFVGDFQVIQ